MFATKFDVFLAICFLGTLIAGFIHFGWIAVWVIVVVVLRDAVGGRSLP